jgi:hypothetical protein
MDRRTSKHFPNFTRPDGPAFNWGISLLYARLDVCSLKPVDGGSRPLVGQTPTELSASVRFPHCSATEIL